MHRLTVTAAVLLLLSGSAALAQSGADSKPYPMQSGKTSKTSQKNKDACFRDANRYCADEIPEGDMQVLACLKTHRAKLSKACEKVLSENGQ